MCEIPQVLWCLENAMLMSAPLFQARPLECFVHVSITTTIASVLKNYYMLYPELSRSPSGHFKPLLDPGGGLRTAVSELKRPLRNRFGSETVINS
jgi:hypothetical protein